MAALIGSPRPGSTRIGGMWSSGVQQRVVANMAHCMHQHPQHSQTAQSRRPRCVGRGAAAATQWRIPDPSHRAPQPRRITLLYINGGPLVLIHRRDTLLVANLSTAPSTPSQNCLRTASAHHHAARPSLAWHPPSTHVSVPD